MGGIVDSTLWQRVFLAVVALTVFVFAVLAAHWRPIWYDELFTYYVANEPTLRETLEALLQGADTNPPVDYLLRHASLSLFGESAAALRWPSAAAFVAGLLATYAFVRRRASFFASAGAFLLPIGTAAAWFSHEARAYALLFASAALALWAWQKAIDAPTPLRLAGLLAALCLGPYSHYFGVLNFVPVAAGEAWRSWQQRRVDWRVVATMAVACVLMLGLLPFALNATSMQASFWASAFNMRDVLGYYRGFLELDGLVIVALAAAAAIAAVASSGLQSSSPRPLAIPAHEFVAVVMLALTPVSAFALATLATGVLTSRYAIALVPGVAILVGYLLAYAERHLRVVVAVAVAVLAVFVLRDFMTGSLVHRGSEWRTPNVHRVLQSSDLPIAFDSSHQFLEFDHYEPPELAARFVYPMDAATALEVRGFNNDEIALRRLQQIRPLNVVDYVEFTKGHPEFLVVLNEVFWPGLVKALRRDGFRLVPLARDGSTIVLRASAPDSV